MIIFKQTNIYLNLRFMAPKLSSFGTQAQASARSHRFNLKYLNFALFGLAAVLGLAYLINISHLSILGFKLNELKSELSFLASVKLSQEEEVNRARSYQSLVARAQGLSMVPVSDVEHLVVPIPAVAKK